MARGGALVLFDEQDRGLWDRDRILEGLALSEEAAAHGPAGPYTIQARIAAAHAAAATAEETDWELIVRLYEWLAHVAPSPVVELNRAVAVAMSEGPDRGLELIDGIEGLDGYRQLHSARAELLRRLGRGEEAAAEFRRALELSGNAVERRHLERRLTETGAG
jgi:RNA polymerase sigma-70 factor (ECF subfamily)